MDNKPRIFIGSSAESLDIAEAVNVNIDHQAEVTIWRNGFDLSSNTIDSLVNKAVSVDFSLFIFSPDDISIIRERKEAVVRDNVLFELGVFIGSIGKERCFIIKPRGVVLHFPTDLLGITPADYEPNRSDGDLVSAVNHACVQIKSQMIKLKPFEQRIRIQKNQKKSEGINPILSEFDMMILAQLLSTETERTDGYPISDLKNEIRNQSPRVDLSIIKLDRLGYVERRNLEDQNGYEYFSYSITKDGIDVVLENEDTLFQYKSKQVQESRIPDDDIPF